MTFLEDLFNSIKVRFFKKKRRKRKKAKKKSPALKKKRKKPSRRKPAVKRKTSIPLKKKKKLPAEKKKKVPLKKKKTAKPKLKSQKKKLPKKKVPAKSLVAAKKKEVLVGEITHYFSKIQVCVIKVNREELRKGDQIRIKGNVTDFTQTVGSLQVESIDVAVVKKGKLAGIKVSGKAREGDKVTKIT